MVNVCAVAICPSPQDVSYHRFPKNEALQKLWVIRCRRKDQLNVKTAKVCAQHFANEDFERDFKSELMGGKPRNFLKPNSIPSLLLCPGNFYILVVSSDHHKYQTSRYSKCVEL
jgi:hypothetical protein